MLVFLVALQPWVFLPHQHIEISLPFEPQDDSLTNIIPMGEKIEHNESNGNPNGHPGIDFQWNKPTKIITVADGRVINIRKNQDNQFILEQQLNMFYRTVYQELNELDPSIRLFAKVKKGQLLGYTGVEPPKDGGRPKKGDPSRQLHWDFISSSMFVGRLCPLGYFDANSRARVEKIWANVPANDEFKSRYPEICSGVYKDKNRW